MKKWISVGSAIALVGLALLLYLGAPAQKSLSVMEPAALPSDSDSVIQVGVNGRCVAEATREKNVLVSFRATPMLSETGSTVESSKAYAVSELVQSRERGLVIDLNSLQGKVGNDFASYLFSVSICNDQNHDSRCDDPVLYQALKMNGKYLKSVYPEGRLSIQIVNDANLGC